MPDPWTIAALVPNPQSPIPSPSFYNEPETAVPAIGLREPSPTNTHRESAMNRSEPRALSLDDLARLLNVSDPQISPDGQRVAFVVETTAEDENQVYSHLWLADLADGSPRPLTSGKKRDSQPRWSPDGQTLAFVSDRNSSRQIWLLSLAGGEPRQVSQHPVGAREPVWSPDGSRIAFLAPGAPRRGDLVVRESTDDRARAIRVTSHRHKLDGVGYFGGQQTHLWLIDLATGVASQLTDGAAEDGDPCWSPDGARIAFVSDRSPRRDDHYGGGAIHVLTLATGEVARVTPEEGRAAHPSWSPSGDWIAYPGSDLADEASPANTRLWVIRPDGSGARCLTADLDRSVGQRPSGYLSPSAPAWAGDALIYQLGEGPATALVRFGPGGREALTSGRRVVQSFTLDATGQRAALLVTDPVTPPEVWLWDADTGARPISALNASLLRNLTLAQPTDLRLTRPDGTEVEGWLLMPTVTTGGPVPVLLVVHGGPHNYFGDNFAFDHQLYAAQGYAVLYGNPRGSGGYSEAFAGAVCRDWGGEDFQDLLALLDRTIASDPTIDSTRQGIVGHSYGGFMTCWAVGQTDRFAAAVSGACISNLVSFYGTSDIGASWGRREFGGTPYERSDWYTARSPLTYAPRVKTPLLLYHGEADLRCPVEQSEQMFTALHQLGKTVEFVRVPGEPHGVLSGSPAHRRAVREAILGWFGRYL